eukprot:TRINITY_DN6107_c0_g1_i1.p1 TRINITY_DN6107_c0_g1~~TRINITY_DN6107_c0_g1_i1.p1  ORF type:complete len:557 (-),score=90.76 TRINITY_DN6107_c0_g1_i1:101-1732(-)
MAEPPRDPTAGQRGSKWVGAKLPQGNLSLDHLKKHFAALELNEASTKARNLIQNGQNEEALSVLIRIKLDINYLPGSLLNLIQELIPKVSNAAVASRAYKFLFDYTKNKAFLWSRAMLFSMGQPAEFLPYLTDILEFDPRDDTARFNRALCYLHDKKFQVALEELDRVISHNGRHVQAVGHKGIAYMALGRLEKAEKYLAMALRWEKNAMFEKAYQDVRQAITARYAQLREHIRTATNLLNDGDLAAARAQIDLGLTSFPKDHQLWTLLARYFRKMGNNIDARNCYKHAISLGSYQASLEIDDKHNPDDINRRYEDAVARLDEIHRKRMEGVTQTKQEEGIDLIEQELASMKKKRDESQKQISALTESMGFGTRIKVFVRGKLHALNTGDEKFTRKIESWFPEAAANNGYFIIYTGIEEKDKKPHVRRFDEITAINFRPPQPRPILTLPAPAAPPVEIKAVVPNMSVSDSQIPPVAQTLVTTVEATAAGKADLPSLQPRRNSIVRGKSSPSIVGASAAVRSQAASIASGINKAEIKATIKKQV